MDEETTGNCNDQFAIKGATPPPMLLLHGVKKMDLERSTWTAFVKSEKEICLDENLNYVLHKC